jgi:hypothetical protein
MPIQPSHISDTNDMNNMTYKAFRKIPMLIRRLSEFLYFSTTPYTKPTIGGNKDNTE